MTFRVSVSWSQHKRVNEGYEFVNFVRKETFFDTFFTSVFWLLFVFLCVTVTMMMCSFLTISLCFLCWGTLAGANYNIESDYLVYHSFYVDGEQSVHFVPWFTTLCRSWIIRYSWKKKKLIFGHSLPTSEYFI